MYDDDDNTAASVEKGREGWFDKEMKLWSNDGRFSKGVTFQSLPDWLLTTQRVDALRLQLVDLLRRMCDVDDRASVDKG